jgi:phospholipase/carboxylesterase
MMAAVPRASIIAALALVAACFGAAPASVPAGSGAAGSASAAAAEPELTAVTYTVGGDAPTGLLVALHYASGTPAMWAELVAGWDAPLRVLALQGPVPHRRGGYTWFPPDHEQKDEAGKLADVEHVVERVAGSIRKLRAVYPEITRVAVTGFSYGGDVAWLLAIRHPELVDAAVPMGSRLLGDPSGAATAAVSVLQGETDAIIDARRTSARVDALRARGVPIELTVFSGLGHDLSPALIADWRTYLRAALAARR